jgi:hypothetical protein
MKINPRIKIYLAMWTTRINLIIASLFMLTMTFTYIEYLNKKKTVPNLPWYGMFLQVKQINTWDMASPFKS